MGAGSPLSVAATGEASPLSLRSSNSDGLVFEPATSSHVGDEQAILQVISPGPNDLLEPQRAPSPSPYFSADDEASNIGQLSPDAAAMGTPAMPIIQPSVLEDGLPIIAACHISSDHEPSLQDNAWYTGYTVIPSPSQDRYPETPLVSPRGLLRRQPSAENGSFDQQMHLYSTSPCFNHVESRHGARCDGIWMQAPWGTSGAGRDIAARDSSAGPFFLDPPLKRSSVYALSRVTVNSTAPSQPSSICSTATVMSCGGPRMAEYWSYLFHRQGAGPSLVRPHCKMATTVALLTTHQRSPQKDALQSQSEVSESGRLTPATVSATAGTSHGGMSRRTSPQLPLGLRPYSPPPSDHNLTKTSHPIPVDHGHCPLGAPQAASGSLPPHLFLPPATLLHQRLVASTSDEVAAYPPELASFELPDDEDDDDLIDLDDRRPDGMPQADIENLVAYDFNPEVDGSEEMSCIVCMSSYQVEEKVRALPCGHEFHACCVDKWLAETRTCPICRSDASRAVACGGEPS